MIFEDLAKGLLAKKSPTDYEGLIKKLQESLRLNKSDKVDAVIVANFTFWEQQKKAQTKKSLLKVATKKETIKQVKETLRKVKEIYLKNSSKGGYEDCAKYLDEKGLLFEYLTNTQIKSTKLPLLMSDIILFFDQISRLDQEQKSKALAQFPMQNHNEYMCAEGARAVILGALTSLLKTDPLDVSFANLATKSASEFLTAVSKGNQIHITGFVHKALLLETSDSLWHTVSSQISAGKVWEFAKSFNRNFKNEIQAHLAQEQEEIVAIARIFDQFSELSNFDQEWEKFQKALEPHFEKLGISNPADFSNFFQTLITSTDDDEKEFLFNEDAISNKFKDLVEKSTNPIKQENENGLDFNLHDVDAPTKIAEILKNPDSTNYQKRLAITALWILSENFPGNSLMNFVGVLDELRPRKSGAESEAMKEVELGSFVVSGAQQYFEKLKTQDAALNNFINQIIRAIGKVHLVNLNNFYQGLIPDQYLKMGVPQIILDDPSRHKDLVGELLKIEKEDAIKLILHHPQRSNILQIMAKVLGNDLDRISKFHNFLFESALIGMEKQDWNFFKQIVDAGLNVDEFDEVNERALTIFYLAAIKGNLDTVNYLLGLKKDGKMVVDVNKCSKRGISPLIAAIDSDKFDTVKALLEIDNIEVNVVDENEISALHHLASKGRLAEVKTLIEKGAKIKNNNRDCETVFDAAIKGGHLDVVEYFLQLKDSGVEIFESSKIKTEEDLFFHVIEHDKTGKIVIALKERLFQSLPEEKTHIVINRAFVLSNTKSITSLLKNGMRLSEKNKGHALVKALVGGDKDLLIELLKIGVPCGLKTLTDILDGVATKNEDIFGLMVSAIKLQNRIDKIVGGNSVFSILGQKHSGIEVGIGLGENDNFAPKIKISPEGERELQRLEARAQNINEDNPNALLINLLKQKESEEELIRPISTLIASKGNKPIFSLFGTINYAREIFIKPPNPHGTTKRRESKFVEMIQLSVGFDELNGQLALQKNHGRQ